MGKWARYYDLIMVLMTLGREKKVRQLEVKLADIMPGDKVLEIGCGTGTLSLAAKAQAGPPGEVVGLDIAPEMVAVASRKAARKNIEVSFQVGSMASIPFPDNRFNIVICSFMIFHMPEDVRRKGFAEIYRVLKSGGHLCILDVVQLGKLYRQEYDVRELVPVLKEYSFSEVETAKANIMSIWFVRGKKP